MLWIKPFLVPTGPQNSSGTDKFWNPGIDNACFDFLIKNSQHFKVL